MTQERTLTLKASFSVKGKLVVREPGWRGGGLDTELKVGISDNPDFRQLVSL